MATAKVEKKPKKPAAAATKNKGKPQADTVNEKKVAKVSTNFVHYGIISR